MDGTKYRPNQLRLQKSSFNPYDYKPGAWVLKLITAVIYGFRNKLECLSLNTRLGWKGLPGTNTLPYNRNRKLRP